jgi:hypothetical protein
MMRARPAWRRDSQNQVTHRISAPDDLPQADLDLAPARPWPGSRVDAGHEQDEDVDGSEDININEVPASSKVVETDPLQGLELKCPHGIEPSVICHDDGSDLFLDLDRGGVLVEEDVARAFMDQLRSTSRPGSSPGRGHRIEA